jgi:hypothetical protein
VIRLPLTGGRGFSKGHRPPFSHRPTGGVPISLSLFMQLCGPVIVMAHCLPWGIHGEISAPRVTTAIPEALYNITRAVKRKYCKSGRNRT